MSRDDFPSAILTPAGTTLAWNMGWWGIFGACPVRR